MEKLGLNEIRERYLSFFESKGHLRLKSAPLIPDGDQSLLLINSGMAPLKPYFTGEKTPPSKRATSCQKCIRTPDIERVGKTARHGTFFEMLGNFSFGDYFKKEATAWAWEFCTEVMKLPEDRIWITIYENDDEALEIWTKEVGVPAEKIKRFGKEDNFWEIGPGPCGPCSELYFDRGEEHGCGKEDCTVGCECDRFVEFWNLVFTQFESDGKGNYTPLKAPNIDTGMGLERLACIMQGVDNLFEVDTIRSIIEHVSRLSGARYEGAQGKSDVSLRVVSDHIRSCVFMIGDGVLPSNEGRGYVLRKLLRRAARHGRLIGIEGAFLYELADTVISCNENAYPELKEKEEYIKKVITQEEERFEQTIEQGLALLKEVMDGVRMSGVDRISGMDAFKLYDTYGFPLDLTTEIASEQGIGVDEKGFELCMAEQKKKARDAHFSAGDASWTGKEKELLNIPPTLFTGYESLTGEGEILAVLREGEKVKIALDSTPFYAESGGQVGDTGAFSGEGLLLEVLNCQKTKDGVFLHECVEKEGTAKVGDKVVSSVDGERRRAIMRNHTSAHLLHKALKQVLGNHVEQAGSLVDETRVRFDFTHFEPMTAPELKAVEDAVNAAILSGYDVKVTETDVASAKKMGAVALFGEKYGKTVRVVSMGDYSMELCGGTHLANTAQTGLFKILSESGVASGVRRIEGTTGTSILALLEKNERLIRELCAQLKAAPDALVSRAASMQDEMKCLAREIERQKSKDAAGMSENLMQNAREQGGILYLAAEIKGADMNALKTIGDGIREKHPDAFVLLLSSAGEKVLLFSTAGEKAVSLGANAGKAIKEISPLVGGSGGGKAVSASGGGKDPAGIKEAVEKFYHLV